MNAKSACWALACVLLVTSATAQTAVTGSAPCLDLSLRPAVGAHRGFINRLGRLSGLDNGVNVATRTVCPLTTRQKFRMWARKSYSPGNLVVAGVDAAVWQATEGRNPQGYGQGWDAYGARFGASLANTESSRFFQTFLLPVMLQEDPRYFRRERGSVGQRFGYAITRTFVGRTDSGKQRFNFSEVLGAGAAAALTNAYYPQAARTAGRTLSSFALDLGASSAWHVVYEFGPDVLRRLSK